MKELVTILVILLISAPAGAKFFDHHAKGWFWYQTIPGEKLKRPNNRYETKESVESKEASAQLKAQGERWQEALSVAIINPSEENMRSYLQLSKQINQQAQIFATRFKESIWQRPEFDYSLERPYLPAAIIAKNSKVIGEQEKSIKDLATRFGLIFFFKGSCPSCQQLAPVVGNLAQKYQFAIIPISLDEKPLKEFPLFKSDQFLAQRLKITQVPALVLLDPDTNMMAPIAYGYSDQVTIEQKILWAHKTGKFR